MRKVLGILGGLLLATQTYAQIDPNLQVGVLVPLSGPLAPYGQEMLRGAEAALQHFRTEQPQLGPKVSIVPEDSRSLVKESIEAAEALYQKKRVHVVLGPLLGTTSEAVARVASMSKKPLIVPVASPAKLMGEGTNVFRTALTDERQGRILADFVKRTLHRTEVAVMVEKNSSYSKAVADGFTATFQKMGGKVVIEIPYDRGATDFAPQIQELEKNKPAAVILPGYLEDVARILTQAKSAGLKMPFVGSDSWDTKDLLTLTGGDNYRGHYFFTHFTALDPFANAQKLKQTLKELKQPDATALVGMGYDAMRTILEAYVKAGSNLPGALATNLKNLTTTGTLHGPLYFDKSGDARKSAAIMVTTSEGPRFMTRVAAPE